MKVPQGLNLAGGSGDGPQGLIPACMGERGSGVRGPSTPMLGSEGAVPGSQAQSPYTGVGEGSAGNQSRKVQSQAPGPNPGTRSSIQPTGPKG